MTLWLVRAVAAVCAVVAVSACGTPGQPGGAATDVGGGSYGWFAYEPATADASGTPISPPAEAFVDPIARSGLSLPDSAHVQSVEGQAAATGAERYLFVFEVDRATAATFCQQGGLGGAGPVPSAAGTVLTSMGNPPVTGSSRWCAGTSPTDPTWARYVLLDAGDPTTVHLSLHRDTP